MTDSVLRRPCLVRNLDRKGQFQDRGSRLWWGSRGFGSMGGGHLGFPGPRDWGHGETWTEPQGAWVGR